MQTTARNATLEDLAVLLRDQQARKLDVVVGATAIRSVNGNLVVEGAGQPVPHPDLGFVEGPGTFVPTAVCDEGVADKLGVPLAYLRRLRAERVDLLDANVNGWLHGYLPPMGSPAGGEYGPDTRSFLLRCFRGEDADSGIARAFLSDRYGIVDHLDVLGSALEGVRDSGAEVQVVGCDLSERRMRVRVACPDVAVHAPALLAGYRSPFDQGGRRAGAAGNMLGAAGHEYAEDVVFAGFEISNSETGGGAFTLAPRLVVQICTNGLPVNRDVIRAVHLGGRMDEGVIRWSADTQRRALELVAAKARDAVATFLDREYIEGVIADVETKAGKPLANPVDAVRRVGKELALGDARIDSILAAFTRGGQATAGAVLNAVTAHAQEIADPDEAAEVEALGLRALELAAAL